MRNVFVLCKRVSSFGKRILLGMHMAGLSRFWRSVWPFYYVLLCLTKTGLIIRHLFYRCDPLSPCPYFCDFVQYCTSNESICAIPLVFFAERTVYLQYLPTLTHTSRFHGAASKPTAAVLYDCLCLCSFFLTICSAKLKNM